jgi:hypothetical protein
MHCYILKQTKKTELVQPGDLLVLNEEGAVVIFPNIEEAWDFIDDNNIENVAEVVFVRR